jgi:hypothetical protein
MNALIDPNIITPDGLAIPDDTTQDTWTDLHRSIIQCKRAAGKWLSQSRKWATERWGIDYVAETEVQLELALGIECKDKPAALNPADKSKAIVTIEGISQSFSLWHRKMAGEVETWEADRLSRALELLEPMEQQAQAIRARLNDLRA